MNAAAAAAAAVTADAQEEELEEVEEDDHVDVDEDLNNEDESSPAPVSDVNDNTINEEELPEQDFHSLATLPVSSTPLPNRKRKRADYDNVNLESTYLSRLAAEEAEEEEHRTKRPNLSPPPSPEEAASPPPLHETQVKNDQPQRTVFLSNLPLSVITSRTSLKTLKTHLTSLAIERSPKIESIRFRSTPFTSPLPKKASFTTRALNEKTSHATNAYVVFTTVAAARAAIKLNGTVVLDRHIRVDSVAHPNPIDHRRCVFVGNVGFVDDETDLKSTLSTVTTSTPSLDPKKKAKSKANKGDAEEGLWRLFSRAGRVESVRVIRDARTRVGKGIAYVQFHDEIAVERALGFNGQKDPPLVPWKLRVVRCKRQMNSVGEKNKEWKDTTTRRDQKLLGNAGVAEMRRAVKRGRGRGVAESGTRAARPVFEGQRASSTQGNQGLKFAGGAKKKKNKGQVSKRRGRSDARAKAYKENKGK